MKSKKNKKKTTKKRKKAVVLTEEMLKEQKSKAILTWILQIVVTFAIATVIAVCFLQPVTMQEGAMEPTIEIGNKFFMNRITYKLGSPQRGDIIAFKTNSNEQAALHIRRVIGLPGETIQIVNGDILINEQIYVENLNVPIISNPGLAESPVTLQSDEYFVLGDNRNNSEDSRFPAIEKVKKKNIAGKLWLQISPVNEIGWVK